MIINKEGINIIGLGQKKVRKLTDNEGSTRMLHSLGSCNYLKVEPSNHLLFACQFYEKRTICVQEQFNDKEGNTRFEDIYKIRIHELTLRELLLIQSMYTVHNQSEVSALIEAQPTPSIFYKVSLNLGIKSLISYVAFDSKSIRLLLDEDKKQYFSEEFPLFFRNETGESEIDIALGRNQIRSVNMMITYLCKFQNSYVYANLFKHNLVELLDKECDVCSLFNSEIFNFVYETPEWPSTSVETKTKMQPFNKSIFQLRNNYKAIFPKISKKEEENELRK